jgi:fatty-acyl-CoA synthase
MFTSGTTGAPKGVTVTHGNLWWNGLNVDAVLDTRRGDVTLACAPMFHTGTLTAFVIRTLARGGTVVIHRRFDPTAVARDLLRHRVNGFFAAPSMLAELARVRGFLDADLSSARWIVVAGAPVPPSLLSTYAEHGVVLHQAWGLTETSPFATCMPTERAAEKLGSAGLPMPYTGVRVVEPQTRRVLGRGEVGEIVVRGPNVMAGYWEDVAATTAAFDNGWFRSGDLGLLDADGYLYVVDRLKDMIITGAENVYSIEVEAALAEHPAVEEAAVFGVPHARWGEAVHAVVTVSEDVTADQLIAHCRGLIAGYKIPRTLEIRTEPLPRSAPGKLLKNRLRDPFWAGHERRVN